MGWRPGMHSWIKLSGNTYKCTACGLLKELSYGPRIDKFTQTRITTFTRNGIIIEGNPKCND